MLEEQRTRPEGKISKVGLAAQSTSPPPVLALPPLSTPKQNAIEQIEKIFAVKALCTVTVRLQNASAMFVVLPLQREIVTGLSFQWQAVLPQLQTILSADVRTIGTVLQRQAASQKTGAGFSAKPFFEHGCRSDPDPPAGGPASPGPMAVGMYFLDEQSQLHR